MNTFQIHTQLSEAVRAAASIREDLTDARFVLDRVFLKLRLAYLGSCIKSLTWRLRQST